MAYVLERGGGSRCILDAVEVEPFTQKQFINIIKGAHSRSQDYYIARVQHKNDGKDKSGGLVSCSCYDAKQLCRYIFEMVISSDGRKIRIKNFKDPITQKPIHEVGFFRLRYDSETPLRAEYVGNQENFLENNCFRSRIFYQEDSLDALSVNFQFDASKKASMINKRRTLAIFTASVLALIFGTLIVMFVEKGQKPHYNTTIGYSLGEKVSI